jgi:tetratricopeptide (TPR) repeat protein
LEGDAPDLAQEYLQAAIQAGRLSTTGKIALGKIASLMGDSQAAIQIWEGILESGDAPAEIHLSLAQAYHQAGDFPAAAERLRALVFLRPAEAWTHYQLGLTLAAFQPEAALAYLDQAAKLDESLAEAAQTIKNSVTLAHASGDRAYLLISTGRALAQLGEWELAAGAFQQATQERPGYAEAWAFLGEAQQRLGEDALFSLEKAVSLDPRSVSANTFLGIYWQRRQRYDLALDYLDRAARQDPGNPALQVELGNTLAIDGNLAAAAAYYQGAVELAPRHPAFWRSLAAFSIKYEYLVADIALPAAQQAITLAPDDPASLDTLAQVYILLGDLLNAQRVLDEALDKDSNYAPAHLHLGLVYLLQGENALGKAQVEAALEKAGGNPAHANAPYDGAAVVEQARRLLSSYFNEK